MNRVIQFLKDAEVVFIATAEPSGQPHIRPIGSIFDYEGSLYFCTKKGGSLYSELSANPKVELSIKEDARWIRVAAEVAADESCGAKDAMVISNPSLAQSPGFAIGDYAVYKLTRGSAAICSFGTAPEIITF